MTEKAIECLLTRKNGIMQHESLHRDVLITMIPFCCFCCFCVNLDTVSHTIDTIQDIVRVEIHQEAYLLIHQPEVSNLMIGHGLAHIISSILCSFSARRAMFLPP